MLLHTNCLPTELDKPANQSVIAATFLGCDDVPLTPDTKLAKCSDIPAAQTLTLVGQTLSISGGNSVALPAGADDQQLSISGNVISLTDGGSVTLPTSVAPIPQVLGIAGNTISLSGGGGSVTLPAAATATITTQEEGTNVSTAVTTLNAVGPNVTMTGTGATATITVNVAPVVATGVPATGPAAAPANLNVRNLAVSTLDEVWEYLPTIGWKPVADLYTTEVLKSTPTPTPIGAWTPAVSVVAPRSGTVVITTVATVAPANFYSMSSSGIRVDGIVKSYDNNDVAGTTGSAFGSPPSISYQGTNSATAWSGRVAAGDLIELVGLTVSDTGSINNPILTVTYTA